jgi:hypothetical protein
MARNTSRSSGTNESAKRTRPVKKSSTGEAGTKRSSTKKSASDDTSSDTTSENSSHSSSGNRDSGRRSSSGRSAPKATARPPARASQVAANAALELLELTGREVEGVTGLQRTEDGWTVQVEVVEVHRIPDTTDVLALYEVETDSHGSMLGYRRIRRYARGAPGDD